MANNSTILEQKKIRERYYAHREERAVLKHRVRYHSNPIERMKAAIELDKSRNASITKIRKGCAVCSKLRGIRRDLCNFHFRELVSLGQLPGIIIGRKK